MKRIKFIICFLLFLLLYSISAFAQPHGGPGPHDWWYTLERGKVMFRQGDYGRALLAFEDARRQRQTMYERLEKHLINLLSVREVRRFNDSLELAERFIQDRHYDDAAEALAELYYRIPRPAFNNSSAAALDALGTLKDYPEAEYWIGETYLIEGELQLAMNQFQKTLALQPLFENPGLANDLHYKIAAILRTRQEYNEMERVLLMILSGDRLWAAGTSADIPNNQQQAAAASRVTVFTRQAMTRTLENYGVNRFLSLYRYGAGETVKAHQNLGFYFYSSSRYARAQEHLMFAFLIQSTIIIDEIIRHRYDFTSAELYQNNPLAALVAEINNYPLLLDYAEKTGYFKTAYYLGASLYGNGKTIPAREIWDSLSGQNLAGEWQVRSIAQLRSPFLERALEMP